MHSTKIFDLKLNLTIQIYEMREFGLFGHLTEQINIVEMSHIALNDVFFMFLALYARTKIVCNQCKSRHQKTSERTRWDVTVFNEVLTFTLPEAQIRECILTLSVYELCPRKRSKRLIGQLSFGKSQSVEDEHWSLMMHALRQPVAKWHLLYL